MSKSFVFAMVLAACGANVVLACDQCNAGGGPNQWVTGCCEHQPMESDHLWDDYCNEQHCAPRLQRVAHFGGAPAGIPACSRWRPRGACVGGNCHGGGGGGMLMPAGVVEAPVYLDSSYSAPSAPAMAAPAHGVGCLCPQCRASATPASHGPGCICPQCQGSALELAPAPVPSEILEPAPAPHPTEMNYEPTPIEAQGTPIEQEIQPPLKQQPFQPEAPAPAEEIPSKDGE